MDVKIEPVWSEEPFIVPDPGGGKMIEVTQDFPIIKTEESDSDGEMRQIGIPNTETEKAPSTTKQDKEMFHSASEMLPNIRVPETEGDSRPTQSSIETVWIKQEANDEEEIMYDESNYDEDHHTISLTDNIWDANTTGSAECAEISGLDNKQKKSRRKKTHSKHTKRLPHNKAAPVYKLDSNMEDLDVLSSCQQSLPCKEDLGERISQNTRVKSYACHVCKKSFFRRAFLSRHLEGHEENQLFSCDACGKQVKSKEALKRHFYAQHTEEVLDSTISNNTPIETHACNVCTKTFYRSYHLKRHMLVHSDERPYSCQLCAKRFKDRHQVKAHYNIHIVQRTESGKQSTSNESLNNDLSTHNSEGTLSKIISNCSQRRTHPCNKCIKSFDRRSRLKKHMLLHSDELTFTCKICGEVFEDQFHLDVHCNIHSKDDDDDAYNLFL